MATSDEEDAAWRAWARPGPAGDSRPPVLKVVGLVLLVALCGGGLTWLDHGSRQGLGDEVELPVVFFGNDPDDRPRGEARVAVTPLRVRTGRPADLAGWNFESGAVPAPTDVPHYVEVRVTNRGVAQLDVRVGLLSAYDEEDRLLTHLRPARPGTAEFPACPEPLPGREIWSTQSAVICFVVAVPAGRRLDRLSAGGVGLGKPAGWSVD